MSAEPLRTPRPVEAPLVPLPASLPAPDAARDVLAMALDRFERVALATSLGPQSLVLLDLLAELGRLGEVDVLFLDTHLHFEATRLLLPRVEAHFGVRIERVEPALTLAEQAARHGGNLWRRDPDACCHLRKVLPLQRALAGRGAWIAGLRRDHGPSRADLQPLAYDPLHGLVKAAPLWRWSREQVRLHLRTRGIPSNPLLDDGYPSVGCAPCTTRSEGERDGRWAGRPKTECGLHVVPAPWSDASGDGWPR